MYLFCTVIGVYVPHVIIEMSYNDSFNVNTKRFKHEKGRNGNIWLPTRALLQVIEEFRNGDVMKI